MKGRGVYVSVELEARDDDQTAKAEQSENKRTFFFVGSRATRKIIIIPVNHPIRPVQLPRSRQSADTEPLQQLLLVPLGKLSPHTPATNPAVRPTPVHQPFPQRHII